MLFLGKNNLLKFRKMIFSCLEALKQASCLHKSSHSHPKTCMTMTIPNSPTPNSPTPPPPLSQTPPSPTPLPNPMHAHCVLCRDASGRIVRPAPLQSRLPSGTRARIEPNRRWFGNTRVIKQDELQRFQAALDQVKRDPLSVILKASKLPVTLLQEKAQVPIPSFFFTFLLFLDHFTGFYAFSSFSLFFLSFLILQFSMHFHTL